jgi:hypothetical protein
MAKDYNLRDLGHDLAAASKKVSEDISEWVGSIQVDTLLWIIAALIVVVLFGRFLMRLWEQDPRWF